MNATRAAAGGIVGLGVTTLLFGVWSARPASPMMLSHGAEATGERLPVQTVFTVPGIDPSRACATVTGSTVSGVRPSGGVVPENLLRFYVEFSQPMRRGEVYDHVKLLDEQGEPVEGPFLRIGHELWSPDMRQLTLLLDPGRIKHGVAPHEQMGPPMTAGRRYTLVIGALADAAGCRGRGEHHEALEVGPADLHGPDPAQWVLGTPPRGSREPLTIMLDAPIDGSLAARLLRLDDERGTRVLGSLVLGVGERTLSFPPDAPWTGQRYSLAVHPFLEDYAGNRVSSAFEMSPGTVAELAARGSGEVVRRRWSPTPEAAISSSMKTQ